MNALDLTRLWVYLGIEGGHAMKLEDLKKRKNNLKMTVAELAMRAELPVGTVSKIMTGETKNPSYLTVEILDRTLAKEESNARVESFRKAIGEYIDAHPDEEFVYSVFEDYYRKKHHLNNKAIPYATPDDDEYWISGDLALAKDEGSAKPKKEGYVTFEEFCRTSDESRLYELMNGMMIVNEQPSVLHQKIVHNLGYLIEKYIRENNGPCMAFDSGVGVRFFDDEDTYLVPDIVVVCDQDFIKEKYILGPPDWVIEVTSPSTASIDRKDKLAKYMLSGVREYWIVDPDSRRVTVHIFNDDIPGIYSFEDEIPVRIYDGKLKICLNDCL